MTAVVAWVGVDQRGPSSASIASDSRITFYDRDGKLSDDRWSTAKKCFACGHSPDVFGFEGDVLVASVFLSQFVDVLDHWSRERGHPMPADARHELMIQHLARTINDVPASQLRDLSIVHSSRDGDLMQSEFYTYVVKVRGGRIRRQQLDTPTRSSVLALGSLEVRKALAPHAMGSGGKQVHKLVDKWRVSKADTTDSILGGFYEAIREPETPTVGGPAQVVRLIRKGPPQRLAVAWDDGGQYLSGGRLFTPAW